MKKVYIIALLLLLPFSTVYFLVIRSSHKNTSAPNTTQDSLKKKYINSDIQKETAKKFLSDQPFPDSIVINPLQFVNTFVFLDTQDFEFDSISVDVNVHTSIPGDYKFYIAPLCGSINKMQFYCGLISGSDGRRNGIFSRWMERNTEALKTTGEYTSSDKEGDNIEVTNNFQWDKGRYRVTLVRTGYIPGKAIPETYTRNDLMFTWGAYEHSWVTMIVENLAAHQKVIIGSLAFPGKRLLFSARNIIFLEHYGTAINFAQKMPEYDLPIMNYKDLPVIRLDIEHITINDKLVKPISVKTHHNYTCNPNQPKIPMPIPLLSKADYNAEKGLFKYEVGSFQNWHTPH